MTYRVKLLSIELQNSSGSTTQQTLGTSTQVDLVQLENVSEIVSAATVNHGSYSKAVVTLDYTDALIVADDGSPTGVELKAVGPGGAALGPVALTLQLDSSTPLEHQFEAGHRASRWIST